MKKTLTTALLFFIITPFFAQIPNGYYDDAEGLEGEALRMALRSITTSGHSSNDYDDLYYYYESTDNFGDNKVWDMYSMDGNGNASYYFYFDNNQECGNYSNEGDCYNREHSVPQSWFNSSYPMQADLFIVVPTDGKVNGMRSNLPFGETDAPNWTSTNGSKRGDCSYPGYSGSCFEPIDDYKGDFARAYFYVVTRYNVSNWGGASFNGDGFSDWTLEMMLEWHNSDPVSQKEIDRNNAAYDIQNNRNPYIDNPDWVQCVFEGTCGILPAENITANPASITQININWSLNDNNNNVLLAYSTDGNFGEPTGTYTVGSSLSGGGTVIYMGNDEVFNHTDLLPQTYYYRLWSYEETNYSDGISTSSSPYMPEPTNNVTNFSIFGATSASITLEWTDAIGSIVPDGYLIRMDENSTNIEAPTDGTTYADDDLQKNVAQNTETVVFGNLEQSTEYFFKIYPYSNSGEFIDYKTDETPLTSGITGIVTVSDLFISEVATKGFNTDYNNEYVEITNLGSVAVDLATVTLEYYEGTTLEADVDLQGVIEPNSAFLIATRASYNAITPDFVSEPQFSLNQNCYLVLKENGGVIDLAGNENSPFIDGSNYEFTDCNNDNEPVTNWLDLGEENGTPGENNCPANIYETGNTKIVVYPNPSTGSFTVESNESEIISYEIIDSQGKSVEIKNSVNANYQNIIIEKKGLLFIKINTTDNIIWKKIIIK